MKQAQTVILKKTFYDQHVEHKEILANKDGRPYLSLIIEYNDKIFAIPFRTNIKHKYAFIFKTSTRKTDISKGEPGIDYTKSVVIKETDIERHCAINKNEWIEINKNLNTITNNFMDYIKKFIASIATDDFKKLPVFKYSSLQYFIEDIKSIL